MRYMVKFTFSQEADAEFKALIPAEYDRVAELKSQGILEELYLAADHSEGWLVMQGKAQEEVAEAVASLPLFRYMQVTYKALQDLSSFGEASNRLAARRSIS